MADTQSRLAEIYKAEKSKGGGIASTLGKRTLEKVDPRQFFNQKGFMAAALPSLFKSYSATPAKSGGKVSSLGSGSFSTGALETKLDILTGETRELKIHSKLAAKNSMSLPDMARDMNVMRQNITKLVKQLGGETTNKADMYFKKSSENEAAYENRFIKEAGKSKTPTQIGAKPEEKKGIFATIMEGLSSIFSMKGALIAGILAAITFGINEYFTNDDFKLRVNSFLGDMFTTIKDYFMEKLPVIIDFMRDHWKELAFAFALLFPKTTMDLIAGGLNVLSSGITLLSKAMNILIPILEVTLVNAFRGLVTLLSGPAGLILLLGGALFAARKLFDQNQEEYLKLAKEKKEKGSLSEKDEARLKELNSPTNEAAAEKQLGYNPITGKVVTQQEANRSMDQRQKDTGASDGKLKRQAEDELMNEAIKAGKDPSDIKNKDIETRFQLLKKQRNAMNSAPNESSAETARLAGKPTPVTPTPAAPSTTPTPMAMPETALAGGVDPSKTTFNDLTREQQDIFMQKQREAEGFKPGSLTYDLNNPGAMLYSPWQRKYGAELDTTGRGAGTVKGLFARFPTLQDGVEAQRALLSGTKYGNLPLEQAINQWTTGNKFSDVDTNMGAGGEKNTGYKNKIYAALGASPATSSGLPTTVSSSSQSVPPVTVASASQSTPAKLPSSPLATLMASAPKAGSLLESLTGGYEDVLRSMQEKFAPNQTNITNNTVANAGQQGPSNLPSVYDDEMVKLMDRAVYSA